MPRHVFTAPRDLDKLDKLEGPLVYLNGPIQGSLNWQEEAIEILGGVAPDLHVASARGRNFAGGPEKHMAWEHAFIERAARDGVVMFWCARESKHRCDRAYAAQMRFELGEWAVKSSAGLARLVVGVEKGFMGGSYLQRRLALAYPNIPLCRTLRQACVAAVELTRHDGPQILYPRTLAEMFVPSIGFKNSG
jgi:hypothetical protein